MELRINDYESVLHLDMMCSNKEEYFKVTEDHDAHGGSHAHPDEIEGVAVISQSVEWAASFLNVEDVFA